VRVAMLAGVLAGPGRATSGGCGRRRGTVWSPASTWPRPEGASTWCSSTGIARSSGALAGCRSRTARRRSSRPSRNWSASTAPRRGAAVAGAGSPSGSWPGSGSRRSARPPGDHPFYAWMRAGFALFGALAGAFPRYRSGDVAGHALEVFPAATAAIVAGHGRPRNVPKGTFRRQVLDAAGVTSPVRLPNIDRVDAALAALTGVYAMEGRGRALGAPDEGVIVVPVPS
jgi:hypothetical protein